MSRSDSAQSLLGKKFTAAKSGWFADAADFFVLLSSFLLTTASIVLVALIFHAQSSSLDPDPSIPSGTLSILQRAISTLSTIITSAVMMVAGKRYVFSKLTRGGIRSRRVAVYSHPSIGNLAYYLVRHGLELPLLALLGVWALALVTGFTVNDAWAMVPVVQSAQLPVPFGPYNATAINPPTSTESIIALATEQLDYVMTSVCSGVAGSTGVINITGEAQLASMDPVGPLFYPPLPGTPLDMDFSFSTWLNGVNIFAEPLSSPPITANNLTCAGAELLYEGGDSQTLSIISTTLAVSGSWYRLNVTPVILGGTLKSTSNTTEFVLNGTARSNAMLDDLWAQAIISLVCNSTNDCLGPAGGNLLNFAVVQSSLGYDANDLSTSTKEEIIWSTVLGMAMGAYSSAWWPNIGTYVPTGPVTFNDQLRFTLGYGVYILIANIVVSGIMLVVVVKLCMASRLGVDFINPTRLLLDPLKNPELFNASLDATVDALANPYMLVREGSEFLLAEQASEKRTRRRRTRM